MKSQVLLIRAYYNGNDFWWGCRGNLVFMIGRPRNEVTSCGEKTSISLREKLCWIAIKKSQSLISIGGPRGQEACNDNYASNASSWKSINQSEEFYFIIGSYGARRGPAAFLTIAFEIFLSFSYLQFKIYNTVADWKGDNWRVTNASQPESR